MMIIAACAWILKGWLISSYTFDYGVYGARVSDAIKELPEWSPKPLPSKQYSGYLNIKSTTNLHYWFVESESDPAKDPVVLWLNGGPGCSSMDGFFYELGPFELTADGGLSLRPYRWNRFANMLFIEAPVGVGFSYSTVKDYANNDDRTAYENMLAIEEFFRLFPEFASNPFYITGESYAGVYIPTLAEAILLAVDNGTYTGAPLKGIAVGNGCTGFEVGICGWYFGGVCEGLYYSTKFILDLPFLKQSLKDSIDLECDWSHCQGNQTLGSYETAISSECLQLLDQASIELGAINIYNVYGTCTFDSCDGPEGNQDKIGRVANINAHLDRLNHFKSKLMQQKGRHIDSVFSRVSIRHHSINSVDYPKAISINGTDDNDDDGIVRGPVGCIDSALATNYLMRKDVQRAIHVIDPDYCWAVCNQAAGWTYEATRPNLPRDTYPYLISRLRVLIYNGDWDACVPYTDNAAWTENMGLPVASPWKSWFYQDSVNSTQIGGYSVQYDTSDLEALPGSGASSFEFRTVRGAGHMVPTDTPIQGLTVLGVLLGVPQSKIFYPATASPDDDASMECPIANGKRPVGQVIVVTLLLIAAGVAILYLYREVKRLRLASSINNSGGSNSSSNPMYVEVNANDRL